jgi:hypothetical protein
MKLTSYLFAILVTSIGFAQLPGHVKQIDAKPNKTTSYSGNLSDGKKIDDLRWASTSSNACFPATQNTKFRGNNVLHFFKLPAYSEVSIKLIPKDPKQNMSLYGYQVGTTNFSVPPQLPSCVACEADHKWDRPKRNQTQDHTRSIEFNSIKNPYNIFIGVAGANDLTAGDYTIEITMKTAIPNKAVQEPLKIYTVETKKGETTSVVGDLSEGVKIHNISSWAASGNVACFPGTQNAKFRGNHVHYVTKLEPYSKMEITVIPADKNANFSIYAYTDGVKSTAFPPKLYGCVECEAEHKWDYPKRNLTQDHTRTVTVSNANNPYRVVIGVVGANGLSTGKYTLKIKVY